MTWVPLIYYSQYEPLKVIRNLINNKKRRKFIIKILCLRKNIEIKMKIKINKEQGYIMKFTYFFLI